MMGRRPEPQLPLFWYLPAVPQTIYSKRLEELLALFDWEAVRERTQAWFARRLGRPSWDPVLIVRIVLIHKAFGLPSYAIALAMAQDSLACRAFLGLTPDDDKVPSQQSLSDWFARLGADYFEDLLADCVLHCGREGMRLSQRRVVDAAAVKAQAAKDGPKVELEVGQSEAVAWVQALLPEEPPPAPAAPRLVDADAPAPPAEKKPPTRAVNLHDPEARLSRKPGQKLDFYYQVSFASDPVSGLVCSTIVKATEEPVTMVEHVAADLGEVRELVADSLYDAADPLAELVARGVQAAVPEKDRRRPGQFGKERFVYEAEADCYWCPAGERLPLVSVSGDGQRNYRAAVASCEGCRLKRWCTGSRSRNVSRQAHEAGREQTLRSGPRYEQWQEERRVQEHLWRMARRDHGMGRADGLGLQRMRIQASLTGICINARKLAKFQAARGEGGPGAVQAAEGVMTEARTVVMAALGGRRTGSAVAGAPGRSIREGCWRAVDRVLGTVSDDNPRYLAA